VPSDDCDPLGDCAALALDVGVAAADWLLLGDCALEPDALGECTGDSVPLGV